MTAIYKEEAFTKQFKTDCEQLLFTCELLFKNNWQMFRHFTPKLQGRTSISLLFEKSIKKSK